MSEKKLDYAPIGGIFIDAERGLVNANGETCNADGSPREGEKQPEKPLIAVSFHVINSGKRGGRAKRVYVRELYEMQNPDASPEQIANQIANELFETISKPFLAIREEFKQNGVLSDLIEEKIFAERDKLFWQLESKEFDRAFGEKLVGRAHGVENTETPKYTKDSLETALKQFVHRQFNSCGEIPTQKAAAKTLGFGSEKSLQRKRRLFGDERHWTQFCKDILND